MTEHLDITETRQALTHAEAEVVRLRGKLLELQGQVGVGGTQAARDDAAFAQAVIDGADVETLRTSTITRPALTMSELRRAIAGTEQLLTDAQARLADCKSAHRRAAVAVLREALAAEQRAFDAEAAELAQRWCRVRAVAAHLEQYTGTAALPHTWLNLKIPRAVAIKQTSPFIDQSIAVSGDELIHDGRLMNGARAAIAQELSAKGVS